MTKGRFKEECFACGAPFALWVNTVDRNYFCRECAGKLNVQKGSDGRPICWPTPENWVFRPTADNHYVTEDKDKPLTLQRIVRKVVALSATEWMVYFDTNFKQGLFETASTFHLWIKRSNATQ